MNFQGEAYLEACIRSIQALEHEVAEIIVVENASTDSSLNVLNTHFRSIEVLRMKENVGASTAPQRGPARGEASLGPARSTTTSSCGPTRSRACARPRRRAPTSSCCRRGRSTRTTPSGCTTTAAACTTRGSSCCATARLPLTEATRAPGGIADVDVAISLALLVDKKAVVDVGAFDEEMFVLFEDLDLSYRLRASGHGVAVVEDALCEHDAGTAGISHRAGAYPERRVFLHSRNRWIFIAKNYRSGRSSSRRRGSLVYELAWFLFVAPAGARRRLVAGQARLVRAPHRLRQKRRSAQRQRTVGDRPLLLGGPLTFSPAVGRR